jgi:starvation-inducible outer membrane lipoprotein
LESEIVKIILCATISILMSACEFTPAPIENQTKISGLDVVCLNGLQYYRSTTSTYGYGYTPKYSQYANMPDSCRSQ